MTVHQRKCWDCGNVAEHADNIVPEVCCKKCGSQDTRLVRTPEELTRMARQDRLESGDLDVIERLREYADLEKHSRYASACMREAANEIEHLRERVAAMNAVFGEVGGSMIHKMFRVECDHCGALMTVTAVDESEAMRRLSKRDWVERDHGYGNRSQYCNDACRDNAIERDGLQAMYDELAHRAACDNQGGGET